MRFPYAGRFGDFIEIILGGTPKTSNSNYWGGDIPWASVVDFTDNKRLYITEKTITKEGLRNSNTKLLKQGDIILSARGTVGKLVVCGLSMAFNQSCYALRTKDNCLINQDFLYYYVKHIVTELQQKAVGGVFDTIIKSTLDGISLFVPEVSKQRKIASILSAYDDLIENNLRRIKLLEEAAQMIYQEWFVKFKFPGYEKTKFVNGLPEGWKINKLQDICTKVTDGTHDTPKEVRYGFPLITGKNIKNGFIDFSDCYNISEKDHLEVMRRSKPEYGDIIYSNIGTLGSTYLVMDDKEYSIKNVALIKPEQKFQSLYLYMYFTNKQNMLQLEAIASGTSQKFLSLKVLRNLEIVNPSINIMKEFDCLISPVFLYRMSIYNQINKLKQARDILLPKLMSGEIEV